MFETEREQHVSLATWIDCEGNISLRKRSNPQLQNGCFWLPEIAITNTSRVAIDLLQEMTGGTARKLERDGDHWKTKWIVYLSPNKCRLWLPKIRPFLVIKQQQADLLLEALALLRQNQRWAGPGKEQGKLQMVTRFGHPGHLFTPVDCRS